MKYTRYNKKNKNNSIFSILFMGLIIIFVAFLIGTIMSRILFKDKMPTDEENKNGTNIVADDKKENNNSQNGVKLYSIQCGFFKEKANAEQLKNKLNGKYSVFLHEDTDGFRALVGIYEEEKCNEVIKKLTDDGISPVKVSFDFGTDNLYNAEIGEICDANIKIYNKLEEEGVKSIPTTSIKEWTKELKEVEGESDNKELLQELKDYTLKLPDEILKSDIEKYYNELFGMIKKFKK